jgi:hypothetical protein
MDVNRIKILNTDTTKNIVVPLGENWDLLDRGASILEEEQKVIEQVIGKPINYELSRFSHDADGQGYSKLTYIFNFSPSISGPWENSYLSKFTESQVQYASPAFNKSFFKLDFYNSMDPKTQKNYLTVVLPTRLSSSINESTCYEYYFTFLRDATLVYTDCCMNVQTLLVRPEIGENPTRRICVRLGTITEFKYYGLDRDGITFVYLTEEVNFPTNSQFNYSILLTDPCECSTALPTQNSNSRPLVTPTIFLDHFGNKEGFYLHWFEDQTVTNITTFYMTAKFFNAATGQYIKFINAPQSDYSNIYKVPNNIFYYRVDLDYATNSYIVYNNTTSNRTNEINWYEYINPPIG